MISDINNIAISVISAMVPQTLLSVSDYTNGLVTEKEAKRLAKNTGFEMLRIVDEYTTTSDLCFAAAEKIFNDTDIRKEDIDAIVFVSQTPDHILPATSHILQSRLGLSENVIALDINQGCSGYVYGLYVSSLLVNNGNCNRILLCAGDTISKLTGADDRSTRTIFGDGGTATIISKGNDRISFHINSLGEDYKSIIIENSRFKNCEIGASRFLSLDGMKIMNFTLDKVPINIQKLLDHIDISKDEVDLFACHQANKLILHSIADKLEVDRAKIPFGASKIGNTSSASIPLLLTQEYHVETDRKNLKRSIVCGFGVGLSIATACVDLSNTIILRKGELCKK